MSVEIQDTIAPEASQGRTEAQKKHTARQIGESAAYFGLLAQIATNPDTRYELQQLAENLRQS